MNAPSRFTVFRGPNAAWLLALVAVLASAALWWHLRARRTEIEAELQAKKNAGSATAQVIAEGPASTGAGSEAQLAELRSRVVREKAARVQAEERIAAAEQRLSTRPGEVTVSLGRIEQIAHDFAIFLPLLAKMKPDDVTKAGQDLEAWAGRALRIIEVLPEIARSEDAPAEIARLHASLLQQLHQLDDQATAVLRVRIETEFAQLKTRGLTGSQRPLENPAAWDAQRDAAIGEMATRLRTALPPAPPDSLSLEAVLGLGGGLRTTVKDEGNSRTMMMHLPGFPALP